MALADCSTHERAEQAVRSWATAHGIVVRDEELPPGKAGQFNGTTVTMNRDYLVNERLYYLVHALGSIILWSIDKDGVQAMFDELRDSKKEPRLERRFEAALERFRDFETESSRLAVQLLTELGFAELVAPYSNFMRADLESITIFHRTGRAPVWKTFFAAWNLEQAEGRRRVEAFPPRSIPPFKPERIENQEILQEQA